MNLNLDLKTSLKNVRLLDGVKKNKSIILMFLLFLLALAVGYIMYGEIRKVMLAIEDTTAANMGRIQRVNVTLHEELVKRLEENSRFEPGDVPNADAFSAPASSSTP